ncbi:hypothetical protein ACFE04_000525 [Oxalis oulophora]
MVMAPKPRKRVEAESTTTTNATSSSTAAASLLRAKDGSAFAKCGECNKDVPVALIGMHSCSLDAKIKMNLEAQVVEMPSEVKKPVERKRSTSSSQPKAAKKAKNGTNGLKRPATAFFIFMDDFRKEYKEANPDAKGVKEVAKQGGEKWRNLSDEEKKVYQDKAAELKAEYTKALENNAAENEEEVEEVSEKEEVSPEKEEEKEDEVDKELEDY